MLGFKLFKSIGVFIGWLSINIWNKMTRKGYKRYSEIWDGNQTKDYLNNMGYDIFYCGLGLIMFLIIVWFTMYI